MSLRLRSLPRLSNLASHMFDLRRITLLTVKFIPFFLITWYVAILSTVVAAVIGRVQGNWSLSGSQDPVSNLTANLRRDTGSSSTSRRHSSRRPSWSISTSMAMRWYGRTVLNSSKFWPGAAPGHPRLTGVSFTLAAFLPLYHRRQAHHVGSARSTRPQLWRPHGVSCRSMLRPPTRTSRLT